MVTPTEHRVWQARAGLILGPVAWLLDQQLTSDWTYAHCDSVHPEIVLITGLVSAAVAATGLLLSWRASRGSQSDSLLRFTAMLGMLSGALALLVVAAGTAAGFLLPGCFQ
jgi:hypothetical protein